MAKKSMINRELKREKMVAKYAEKRVKLKETISDINASDEAYGCNVRATSSTTQLITSTSA